LITFKHTRELPHYRDPSFLHQKYIVEKLSIAQIASQTFSSKPTIRKALVAHGIQLRSAYQHPEMKPLPSISEMRIIRAIVELKNQRMNLRQIAKFLSQMGVPTKSKGLKWHPMMISRIFQNLNECDTQISRAAVNEQGQQKGEGQSFQESIASSLAQGSHSSKASDKGFPD